MTESFITLLLIVVLIGVVFNLTLFAALHRARLLAIEGLRQARATLADVSDGVIRYDLEIKQTVPVKMDVPVKRTIQVPVKAEVPINTLLDLPIKLPIGTFWLEVPLETDVPVDLVIPVPVDETINVDAKLPLEMTTPLEIHIAHTPLRGYLTKAQETLNKLASDLEHPLALQQKGGAVIGQVAVRQIGRLLNWLIG